MAKLNFSEKPFQPKIEAKLQDTTDWHLLPRLKIKIVIQLKGYKQTTGARSFARPTFYQTDLLPDHKAIIQLR